MTRSYLARVTYSTVGDITAYRPDMPTPPAGASISISVPEQVEGAVCTVTVTADDHSVFLSDSRMVPL